MSLEQITLAGPIRERLRLLKNILPGRDELVYKFAETFAEALRNRERLVPAGFYNLALEAQSTLACKIGKDPIEILGIHCHIEDSFSKIFEAVCPKDFLEGLKEYREIQGLL